MDLPAEEHGEAALLGQVMMKSCFQLACRRRPIHRHSRYAALIADEAQLYAVPSADTAFLATARNKRALAVFTLHGVSELAHRLGREAAEAWLGYIRVFVFHAVDLQTARFASALTESWHPQVSHTRRPRRNRLRQLRFVVECGAALGRELVRRQLERERHRHRAPRPGTARRRLPGFTQRRRGPPLPSRCLRLPKLPPLRQRQALDQDHPHPGFCAPSVSRPPAAALACGRAVRPWACTAARPAGRRAQAVTGAAWRPRPNGASYRPGYGPRFLQKLMNAPSGFLGGQSFCACPHSFQSPSST